MIQSNTEKVEHSHYHFHDDQHFHSHESVVILDEIQTSNGVKHIHAHSYELNRQCCEVYHI